MAPQASVILSTKNRKQDLPAALKSALAQTVPVEVIVIDDGSTDGTSEMIRAEFPAVRVERFEQSQGYIVQRNRLAEMATAPVVFSIDDDAAFSTPYVVEQTLKCFSHPRVGAVAIPFINVNQDQVLRQKAPTEDRIYATQSYIGTAHALRRDVFQRLGGYRPFLVHQTEESDYCIRMLNAGYIVRLGVSDPVHHFESPRRNLNRMHFYGRRNNILFTWFNVPWPYVLPHLAGTTIKGLLFGLRHGGLWPMTKGTIRGYWDFRKGGRYPVSRRIYKLYRTLGTGRPFEEIEHLLSQIC